MRDAGRFQVYDLCMTTFIEHIVKLTDHRDRDLLELTLSKALIDLLPVSRIVIARVMREEGVQRWLEVARLDAKGGGRVIDPLGGLPDLHARRCPSPTRPTPRRRNDP